MTLFHILLIAKAMDLAVDYSKDLETLAADIVIPPLTINNVLILAERADAAVHKAIDLMLLQLQQSADY